MGRMIDADALINRIDSIIKVNRLDTQKVWFTPNGAKLLVEEQPTIEERKTGRWRRRLVDSGFNADWHCSECGWKTSLEEHGYDFCPNCGAKMEGEENG